MNTRYHKGLEKHTISLFRFSTDLNASFLCLFYLFLTYYIINSLAFLCTMNTVCKLCQHSLPVTVSLIIDLFLSHRQGCNSLPKCYGLCSILCSAEAVVQISRRSTEPFKLSHSTILHSVFVCNNVWVLPVM